jgi:hypothetical protein
VTIAGAAAIAMLALFGAATGDAESVVASGYGGFAADQPDPGWNADPGWDFQPAP